MVRFNYNAGEKMLTCSFSGRLDTNTTLAMGDEISNQLKNYIPESGGYKLIFDLGEVSFISSSFIRVCVSAARLVEKGNFMVTHCDPFIKKTFKIAGLDEVLQVS